MHVTFQFIENVSGSPLLTSLDLEEQSLGPILSEPFDFEGQRIVLLEAPGFGFDDTVKTETEIFTEIFIFLGKLLVISLPNTSHSSCLIASH